ncbi:MAG TPA: curlin repeat-containing protein, partial [Mariniphaga sp.]|nr:curlin repeat-containing protein [Mariniphaga sp.]
MRKLIFVSAFIIAGNVSVAQDGSYADLLQQGDNHSATVTQEGDLNESYVVQKSVNNVVNVNQINTTGDR